jgi:hypothetical protein
MSVQDAGLWHVMAPVMHAVGHALAPLRRRGQGCALEGGRGHPATLSPLPRLESRSVITRTTRVFSPHLEQGGPFVKGAACVYATHVQGHLAVSHGVAHLRVLLRGAMLTVHPLRQPRQNDQGVLVSRLSAAARCPPVGYAALQQAAGGSQPGPQSALALVFACLVGGLVGFPSVVGCAAAAPSRTQAAPVLAPGPGGERRAASIAKAQDPCPSDMVALPSFCMDRYEAPNLPGELPFALQTAGDGETWCSERRKRLCTEDEWVRACQGPNGWRYPYGDEHRESACNDDRRWITVHWDLLARWPSQVAIDEAKRLFQADPSGTRAACKSEEGVYDLTGNVAEWVRRSDPPPRPGYQHVLKGCYWAGCYHEPHPNCVFRNSAHPGTFRTYEAGFRCCSDRAT